MTATFDHPNRTMPAVLPRRTLSPRAKARGRSEQQMFMRRRRPLMRAAVVGGVAYHAGKRAQENQYEDDTTQARLDQLEAQQYQQQSAAAAAPPAGGMSDATLQQLKQLGELQAQAVLPDDDVGEEERRPLPGA